MSESRDKVGHSVSWQIDKSLSICQKKNAYIQRAVVKIHLAISLQLTQLELELELDHEVVRTSLLHSKLGRERP